MCSVSAVSDYYTTVWPTRFPGVSPTADDETRALMRKAIELLERIDKRLGDVECSDESKAAFLSSLKRKPRRGRPLR